MEGLRSELALVDERKQINGKNQQELEEIISGMEDEAAAYSLQVIELEEKLAEKNSLNNSLENKVSQQNLRVIDIKTELEKSVNDKTDLQRQVRTSIIKKRVIQFSFSFVDEDIAHHYRFLSLRVAGGQALSLSLYTWIWVYGLGHRL